MQLNGGNQVKGRFKQQRAPGVTAFEGAEAGPPPNTLYAIIVNEYEVPLVKP